jgi:hypothetical protein
VLQRYFCIPGTCRLEYVAGHGTASVTKVTLKPNSRSPDSDNAIVHHQSSTYGLISPFPRFLDSARELECLEIPITLLLLHDISVIDRLAGAYW